MTYPPTASYPLSLTAKRYWLPSFEANASDPEALTLLFLHSTSFHKETWMPTVEALFTLAASKGSPIKIREAWCLDCPNHGASGQLNATVLLSPEFFLNCVYEVCTPISATYSSLSFVRKVRSSSPSFSLSTARSRRKGGLQESKIGWNWPQSGWCCHVRCILSFKNLLLIDTRTMLQSLEPLIPFVSLILVEPLLSPAGPHHLKRLRELLVKGAYERRDVWPDRQHAMAALKRRERTKKWDPRILDIFVVRETPFISCSPLIHVKGVRHHRTSCVYALELVPF